MAHIQLASQRILELFASRTPIQISSLARGATLLAAMIFWAAVPAQQAQECCARPTGMVAWWPGDGNANDIAGSNNGSLQGSTTANGAALVGSNAFNFDGGFGYVEVPDNASLDLSREVTLDAWIFADGDGDVNQGIISKYFPVGDERGYMIAIAGNKLQLRASSGDESANCDLLSPDDAPRDQWVHVAATVSSDFCRLYIDGQPVASRAGIPSVHVMDQPLTIGAQNSGQAAFFKGRIDEAEVFDRALAAAEIQAIYDAGSAGKCKNQTCATPPPNMVSWYRGEGDELDSQGANDGTLGEGVAFATGKVGQAFEFDGSPTDVSVGNPASLQFSNALTVDAWVRPDTDSDFKYIVAKWLAGGSNSSWLLAMNGDSPRVFVLGNGGSGFTEVQGGAIPTGPGAEFTHVAMTYSATDVLRLYINGVQVGAGVNVGTIANTGVQDVRIGSGGATTQINEFFDGLVDEVEIFDRALTTTEIKEIFNAGVNGKCANCVEPPSNLMSWYPGEGSAEDIAGNNDGSLQNGATATGDGIVGQSFSLDGLDDDVRVTGLPDPNPAYSFDAWVFWQGTVNGSGHEAIVVRNNSANDGATEFSTFIANGDNSLYNVVENQVFSSESGSVPLNQWFHVAHTHDGTTARVYINGNQVASLNQARTPSTGTLGIGSRPIGPGQHHFHGLIDEVEIFNRALSGAEIEKIYRAGARGKCRPPDFGDAPDPTYPTLLANDGARHVIGSLMLGPTIDGELDGQPNATATGDVEDGVSFGTLTVGETADVTVDVTGGSGKVDLWLDLGGDGDWNDVGEKLLDGVSVIAGSNTLTIAIPESAALGQTFARVRLSSAGIAEPTGEAPDGEVEDYAVAIEPVNTAPSIADVPDQEIDRNSSTGPIIFGVEDAETASDDLEVSASSDNTTLVPEANIALAFVDDARSVTVTPAADQSGQATITLTVSDGELTDTDSFTVTVDATDNAVPTISNIANKTTKEDTAITAPFTVGDTDDGPAGLTLAGGSSNDALVPDGNIGFGGSGANRTLTITPLANQFGTTTISVTVDDGDGGSATDTFVLTVTAVNDAPTITGISDQTVSEDQSIGPLTITIGDVDANDPPSSLALSRKTSNSAVVPTSGIVFGGSGASRTVTVTPKLNKSGAATITITVSDGQLKASTSFVLTVTNADDGPPTISDIRDKTTKEDKPIKVSFKVSDKNDPLSALSYSAASSNTALVPVANMLFSGATATRYLTVTPAPNQSGVATLTVTVTDGDGNTASDSFQLTVTPVNDAPTITVIPDQAATSGDPLLVNFDIDDVDNDVNLLVLTRTTSKASLIPLANVVLGGSGANRDVTITPLAGKTGVAKITIKLSDGKLKTTEIFTVTVSPGV